MGAVDEDEVSLLDRFVSPPGRKSRTVSRRTVIRRQDSGDRGLTDSREVGDHRLGQVLAKDQQAGQHLVLQGDAASGQTLSLGLRSHR